MFGDPFSLCGVLGITFAPCLQNTNLTTVVQTPCFVVQTTNVVNNCKQPIKMLRFIYIQATIFSSRVSRFTGLLSYSLLPLRLQDMFWNVQSLLIGRMGTCCNNIVPRVLPILEGFFRNEHEAAWGHLKYTIHSFFLKAGSRKAQQVHY